MGDLCSLHIYLHTIQFTAMLIDNFFGRLRTICRVVHQYQQLLQYVVLLKNCASFSSIITAIISCFIYCIINLFNGIFNSLVVLCIIQKIRIIRRVLSKRYPKVSVLFLNQNLAVSRVNVATFYSKSCFFIQYLAGVTYRVLFSDLAIGEDEWSFDFGGHFKDTECIEAEHSILGLLPTYLPTYNSFQKWVEFQIFIGNAPPIQCFPWFDYPIENRLSHMHYKKQ